MCVSLVAVPERVSTGLLSPQLTVIDETVPSGSVAVKLTVTCVPVFTGFGATLVPVTTGILSFTVSVVVPDPGPALLVAVAVIVNVCDLRAPVEE